MRAGASRSKTACSSSRNSRKIYAPRPRPCERPGFFDFKPRNTRNTRKGFTVFGFRFSVAERREQTKNDMSRVRRGVALSRMRAASRELTPQYGWVRMGTDEYGVSGAGNRVPTLAVIQSAFVRVLRHIIRTYPYKSVLIRSSVGFMSVARKRVSAPSPQNLFRVFRVFRGLKNPRLLRGANGYSSANTRPRPITDNR